MVSVHGSPKAAPRTGLALPWIKHCNTDSSKLMAIGERDGQTIVRCHRRYADVRVRDV